jgi:hypothetical protein
MSPSDGPFRVAAYPSQVANVNRAREKLEHLARLSSVGGRTAPCWPPRCGAANSPQAKIAERSTQWAVTLAARLRAGEHSVFQSCQSPALARRGRVVPTASYCGGARRGSVRTQSGPIGAATRSLPSVVATPSSASKPSKLKTRLAVRSLSYSSAGMRRGDRPTQVAELADSVRAMLDPRRRHQQVAARLTSLAGNRVGRFTLTQHTDPSRAAPTYVLHRSTSKGDESDGGRANAPTMCDAPPTSVRFLPSVEGPGMLDGRAHDEAINVERQPVSDGRITVEFKRGQYVHVDRGFDAET